MIVQVFIDAQYKIGFCYDHEIKVKMHKEKAFYFYEITAKEENCDAQEQVFI